MIFTDPVASSTTIFLDVFENKRVDPLVPPRNHVKTRHTGRARRKSRDMFRTPVRKRSHSRNRRRGKKKKKKKRIKSKSKNKTKDKNKLGKNRARSNKNNSKSAADDKKEQMHLYRLVAWGKHASLFLRCAVTHRSRHLYARLLRVLFWGSTTGPIDR